MQFSDIHSIFLVQVDQCELIAIYFNDYFGQMVNYDHIDLLMLNRSIAAYYSRWKSNVVLTLKLFQFDGELSLQFFSITSNYSGLYRLRCSYHSRPEI